MRYFFSESEEKTALEKENEQLSLRAAEEGLVLLANDGLLPLAPGPVALFGAGAARTVIGGTGSGEVNCRHQVSVQEGLIAEGFTVTTQSWIDRYEEAYLAGEKDYRKRFFWRFLTSPSDLIINIMKDPYGPPSGPEITREDLEAAGTDTAIYVLSRLSGEGDDQKPEESDVSLTETERRHLTLLAAHFKKLVLVLNVGGIFDLSFAEEIGGIGAILLLGQAGAMGGRALAEILKGKVSPSGHLTDTWTDSLSEYPSLKFGRREGLRDHYREDIFVGYRYFDSYGVPVRYSFGHGLSYTAFAMELESLEAGEDVRLRLRVTNTGTRFPGAAVAQIYAGLPSGRLWKENRRLAGFARTGSLAPGEEEELNLSFPYEALASYDEKTRSLILEKGVYRIYVGGSLREAELAGALVLEEDRILSRHPKLFLNAAESRLPLPLPPKRGAGKLQPWQEGQALAEETEGVILLRRIPGERILPKSYLPGIPKCRLSREEKEILASLSLEECISLCVGGGMAPRNGDFLVPGAAGYTTPSLLGKKIPMIAMADGPAGLRLERRIARTGPEKIRGVDPFISFMKYLPGFIRFFIMADPDRYPLAYQHTTAFPVGTVMAQTWDEGLLEAFGKAVGREMKTYGVSVWLAPGLNLHRDPLCGRNFEYFSEDPLLSGKAAAAVIRGTGSAGGVTAVPKHFLCNNREDERQMADACVSERALREIYLRSFQIAVQEGRPGALMSSYNKVNGTYAAESGALLGDILRGEWQYEGLVMTDWAATQRKLADPAGAVAAGNDLIMPGILIDRKRLEKALREKTLSPGAVRLSAARILRAVLAYRIPEAEQ